MKLSTVGRRTRIRPGLESDYVRIHSAIPEPVALALRRSGVVRWHIWIDGTNLFHSIDTVGSYSRFLDEIASLGPVDAAWDAIVVDLLDPEPTADQVLPLVWALDESGQRGGREFDS